MAAADPERPVAALDAVPPTAPVLVASLLQALALFALYRATDGGVLADAPTLALPLWSLTLTAPTLFSLTVGIRPGPGSGRSALRPLLIGLGSFGVFVLALGAWVGHQMTPVDAFPTSGVVTAWSISLLLGALLTLIHLQAACAGAPLDYRILFAASWRGAQVPLLAFAFCALFAGVLWLWAALFSVIGIDVFEDLFEEDWFLFPVLGLAFGTGVLLFRRLAERLGRVDATLRSGMILLLPLALAIAVAFVAALPVTGLAPLWDTGHGTALLLCLLLAILVFVNAVYQDGSDPPGYPRPLARLLGPALCVAPVLAALAGYGLWLRIAQYGLSVDRIWALLIWSLLAACAVGYAGLVIRRRDDWPGGLGRVDTVLGLVLLVLLMALNSPLLDPRRLSVVSQLERVRDGEIDLAELDFHYFRRSLARPGHEALARLRETHADDAALVAAIDASDSRSEPTEAVRDALISTLRTRPADLAIPDALRAALRGQDFALRAAGERWLLRRDLDRDGDADYLLLRIEPSWVQGVAFIDDGGVFAAVPARAVVDPSQATRAGEVMASGAIRTVRPEFDVVLLGAGGGSDEAAARGEGQAAIRIELGPRMLDSAPGFPGRPALAPAVPKGAPAGVSAAPDDPDGSSSP